VRQLSPPANGTLSGMQIGALWLPLPHLLNLVPVQVDVFYQTGLSAVALSVIRSAIGAVALWTLVITVDNVQTCCSIPSTMMFFTDNA
jgi:hypothetical protein